MAWTRDQVHLLRRLQKEMTGRVRSLRFFENVRLLQRDGNAFTGASGSAPAPKGGPPRNLALLSCCGHVGEHALVCRSASDQVCHEAPDCKAAARSSCVISVSELGKESECVLVTTTFVAPRTCCRLAHAAAPGVVCLRTEARWLKVALAAVALAEGGVGCGGVG